MSYRSRKIGIRQKSSGHRGDLCFLGRRLKGVCLVVAVGLTQDLTLILSTKNTKQNKTNKENKTQARIHLLQKKWRGIHCEEYMLCVTASNNILENASHEEDMLCVTTVELHDEDMLCLTASLIVKKI